MTYTLTIVLEFETLQEALHAERAIDTGPAEKFALLASPAKSCKTYVMEHEHVYGDRVGPVKHQLTLNGKPI